MGINKKLISLNQASKISGYHQDYLSSLIRKKEINGTRVGNNWFTTEQEIKDYLFKKKIRRNEFAVLDFFSPGRTKVIFIITVIILVLFVISYLYFFSNRNSKDFFLEVKTSLSTEGEAITEIKK